MRVPRMTLVLLRQNTPERTAQAVVLRVLAALAINKSWLTHTNVRVSIASKKYERVVSEMLQHLELFLPGSLIGLPALAGATSFATAGESGRMLQYVASHDLNAVTCAKDYTSREATIRTGCHLAAECCQLEDELGMQQDLGQALVTLFGQHSTADLEKIIRLEGHLSKKIKDIKQSQATVTEKEENGSRRLRNTKEEIKEIQNIRIHIKFKFSALVHYVINYNLMANIDINIPGVIQNVFSSMRTTEDPARWGIRIMTNVEYKRCLYTLSLIKLLVGTTASSLPQDKSFQPLVHLIINPTTRFRTYASYLLRQDSIKSTPEGLRNCKHCNKLFTWGQLYRHLTHAHGVGGISQDQGKRKRIE